MAVEWCDITFEGRTNADLATELGMTNHNAHVELEFLRQLYDAGARFQYHPSSRKQLTTSDHSGITQLQRENLEVDWILRLTQDFVTPAITEYIGPDHIAANSVIVVEVWSNDTPKSERAIRDKVGEKLGQMTVNGIFVSKYLLDCDVHVMFAPDGSHHQDYFKALQDRDYTAGGFLKGMQDAGRLSVFCFACGDVVRWLSSSGGSSMPTDVPESFMLEDRAQKYIDRGDYKAAKASLKTNLRGEHDVRRLVNIYQHEQKWHKVVRYSNGMACSNKDNPEWFETMAIGLEKLGYGSEALMALSQAYSLKGEKNPRKFIPCKRNDVPYTDLLKGDKSCLQ